MGLDKANLSGLKDVKIQTDQKPALMEGGGELVIVGGGEARVERGDRGMGFGGRVEKKFGDSDWDREVEDPSMKDLVQESFQGDEVLFAIPAEGKVGGESVGSQEPDFALPPPETAVVYCTVAMEEPELLMAPYETEVVCEPLVDSTVYDKAAFQRSESGNSQDKDIMKMSKYSGD